MKKRKKGKKGVAPITTYFGLGFIRMKEEKRKEIVVVLGGNRRLVTDAIYQIVQEGLAFLRRMKGLKRRTVTSRKLKSINITTFKEDVAALQFKDDDQVADYNSSLKAVIRRHAPLTTKRVTDRPSAP
nr:hypothetical protein BaRGS_022073 [Batillaria attramentaria]